MKEYCRYMVIDIDTGMYLAVGEKFKDMTGLDCVCKFKDRRGTERFEVREYFDFKKVHGRSCLFLYWIRSVIVRSAYRWRAEHKTDRLRKTVISLQARRFTVSVFRQTAFPISSRKRRCVRPSGWTICPNTERRKQHLGRWTCNTVIFSTI